MKTERPLQGRFFCHSEIDPEDNQGGSGRIHQTIHFPDLGSNQGEFYEN